MYKQTTDQEQINITYADSYQELCGIALTQLERMHSVWQARQDKQHPLPPIGVVCGPISNGGVGRGDREVNLQVFGVAVASFQHEREGFFFSQMPYEDVIGDLKRADIIKLGKPVADLKLLTEFYLPLFESGKIGEMLFLPDWQTSSGATWERRQGERLGISIHDIPEPVAKAFLAAAQVVN